MHNNRKILRAPAQSALRRSIAAAPFLAAGIAGGAGFGLWSGMAAMSALVALALVLGVLGLHAKTGRRISGVFAVAAFAGLFGVALALADMHFSLSLCGLALAGLSLLVLSKIEQRGWNHV